MHSNAIDLGNANAWFIEVMDGEGRVVSIPGHMIHTINRHPDRVCETQVHLSNGMAIVCRTDVDTVKRRYATYCRFLFTLNKDCQ